MKKRRMAMRKFLLAISFCMLVITGSPGQVPIPSSKLPAANVEADNPVPLATVKAVALNKAREMWGQVTPGAPIPCVDQDGKLAYYMIPFHFGAGSFPSYEHILQGVTKGRQFVAEVEKDGFSADLAASLPSSENANDSNVILHSNGEAPLSGKTPSPGPPAGNYATAHKAAKNMEMGIGEYGTVFVAATFDRFPIPLILNYLPPFYYTGDLALAKANKLLGGDATLNRIYFLGKRGIYFEFALAGKSTTLQAFSLEVEAVPQISRTAATAQQRDKVKEAWQNISSHGGGQ
jgi:hypothetical protein